MATPTGVISGEFRPEKYRSYLSLIAQTEPLRTVAGKVEASDVVQQCLLLAHQKREQFSGRTEAEYRGWLRAILANVTWEFLRRFSTRARSASLELSINATIEESGRRFDQFLAGASPTPSTQLAARETVDGLLVAIDRLPPDQRAAIQAHYLRQLSVDSVAAEMNRSPASVAGLIRRGLQQLRTTLKAAEKPAE